uniref:Uncharacterized protein n=1 Tax=Romanomermis culicivorax TaxID=13658 RepID=A0A915HX96_ROMCU
MVVPLSLEMTLLNETNAFWSADDVVLQPKFNAQQRGAYYTHSIFYKEKIKDLMSIGEIVQELNLKLCIR